MKWLILLFPIACNSAMVVTWQHPTERERCTQWDDSGCVIYDPLSPDEIAGYYVDIEINGAWVDATQGFLYKGKSMYITPGYKFRLMTVDTDGRVSVPSVIFYEDPTPNPPIIQCQ